MILNNLNKSIYAKYISMNKDTFVYNNELTNLQNEFKNLQLRQQISQLEKNQQNQ